MMEITFFSTLFVLTVSLSVCLCVFVFLHRRRQNKLILPTFKAVLITGCDRGFGYMLAKRLDGEGYKVFACCLKADGEGALQLKSETSPRLEIVQLDVTKETEVEQAVATVADSLVGHTLWAVVNNAGIASHAEFEWLPKQNFRTLMEINVMGVVNVTRAFLPLVRAAKGRVINVSSMAGRTALPGFTSYSAAKFAVIGFSDSLRREMEHFGVKVITIEPALYKTDIFAQIVSENETFWNQAEPGIRRDYGEIFFRDTQNSRTKNLPAASTSVYQVVDCLAHAVMSAHPSPRYAPPYLLGFMNDVMNTMPTTVQDFVIKCVMGIKAVPAMLNPTENGRMGRRRSHAT